MFVITPKINRGVMGKVALLACGMAAIGRAQSSSTAPAAATPSSTAPSSGSAKGATKAATKTGTAKAAATKGEPLPEGVPAGAVSYKPYYWRWVDKKGQAWIYHQSPFGIVHDVESVDDREEMAALARKTPGPTRREPPPPGDLTFEDHGDTIEFMRDTPFGKTHWTRKKTELSDEEAEAWAKAQAAGTKK